MHKVFALIIASTLFFKKLWFCYTLESVAECASSALQPLEIICNGAAVYLLNVFLKQALLDALRFFGILSFIYYLIHNMINNKNKLLS